MLSTFVLHLTTILCTWPATISKGLTLCEDANIERLRKKMPTRNFEDKKKEQARLQQNQAKQVTAAIHYFFITDRCLKSVPRLLLLLLLEAQN